jgi:hypothetical protein
MLKTVCAMGRKGEENASETFSSPIQAVNLNLKNPFLGFKFTPCNAKGQKLCL